MNLSNLREALGCDEPEDDLPPPPEACDTCRDHAHHADSDPETRAHGRWYVGVAGYGFRTNRCPRSWASHPTVMETLRALRYAEGGMFTAVYGLTPPAVLVESVDFLRLEINAVQAEVMRQWREDAEDEARQRAGSGRGRHVVVTED